LAFIVYILWEAEDEEGWKDTYPDFNRRDGLSYIIFLPNYARAENPYVMLRTLQSLMRTGAAGLYGEWRRQFMVKIDDSSRTVPEKGSFDQLVS
jgi:hypothetical protein